MEKVAKGRMAESGLRWQNCTDILSVASFFISVEGYDVSGGEGMVVVGQRGLGGGFW